MFTRFSAPRPRRSAPLAGALVSLTAHAALVAVAIRADHADRPPRAADDEWVGSGGAGEGVRWVGGVAGTGETRPPRPGAPLPIAYAVPGRGSLRIGVPGAGGARRGAPAPKTAGAAHPPSRRARSDVRRPDPRHVQLPPLPAMVEVDVALLVPGVFSSAPDQARVASRPEEFTRLARASLGATSYPGVDVDAVEALRTSGPVDVLPIALVGNARPSYPPALERARVGGRVVVEFRIDSAGVVDVRSLRVLHTTNALFTEAVQAVLPGLRFLPAQLGRHAVDITVRQPFVFRVRPGI